MLHGYKQLYSLHKNTYSDTSKDVATTFDTSNDKLQKR